MANPEVVVRDFIAAFNAADLGAIAACLADDLVAEITQRGATTRALHGRDAFMANIEALDIPNVRPRALITQLAAVGSDQVLVMIEVRAVRKARTLHNHAAYLLSVRDGQICRMWMVEALPEASDTFWKG